ncbi:MAG TPA: Uma2 family endonuclease [Verrucomicrobiae bacterium]|nr:Uma2 family endonuclease [Verrucomicrobiae bacterium]
MQAILKAPALSVEEYLAGELHSRDRHEYLGGTVYAMAGTSGEHNLISLNLAFGLRTHLRGKPCQVFMSDVKLRLRISEEDVFYYPDVMVACDPSDAERYFKRRPQVLIEVLSPETESIDRREKFLSYIQIETLSEYILVAQNKMEATVFRRSNKWEPEILNRADEVLRIESLNFALPLNLIYEGVKI